MKKIRDLSKRNRIWLSIVLIAVVLLVFLVGFLHRTNSMRVGQNNDTDKVVARSKQTSPSSSVEPTNDVVNKGDDKNRFVLADWKIEFSLSAHLQETEVKYTQRKSIDNQVTYAFTTARIQALGGECTRQTFGDTVTLSRFTEKPVAIPDGKLLNEKPINGYYYATGGPLAACSSVDSDGKVIRSASDTELKDAAALREFVETLTATQ